MSDKPYLLGVETSCDDSSLALYDRFQRKLAWHQSFSQEAIMAQWGGVVPEIAARNHNEKIVLLIDRMLKDHRLCLSQMVAIAVTNHPGLLGPLLTGVNLAKTLSLVFQLPIIPVNHLYAHLEAIHLSEKVSYPYLGLLISGGHTSFFKANSTHDFEYLGGTIDDAAGEAFDKGGKLLGLDYPSGKIIDDLAKDVPSKHYAFPIGLIKKRTVDLSFSGLKTALRVFIDKNPELIADDHQFKLVVSSYQEAIVQALKIKTTLARESHGQLPLVIGGGVACNSRLRQVFREEFSESVHFVKPEYCTDNAAMIAHYGALSQDLAVNYPESLKLDARSRFIKKGP